MSCLALNHDEIYTLDIGQYNIYGVNINFVAIIQFRKLTVTITLPLPINYPRTGIGSSQIVKKEGLFRALLTIISPTDQSWMKLVNIAQQSLNIKAISAIALDSYYVIPKQHNVGATGAELLLLTGLSKKVLCLSMFYIMGAFGFQPYTTIIVLEASGGTVSTEEDIKRVNNYMFLGKDRLLKIYYERYRNLYDSNYDTNSIQTDRGLAKLLVSLENNSKLVDYYKQYLGFKQLSYPSLETLMGTTLDIVLNICQDQSIMSLNS